MAGCFITFEGGEGVGKTTQIKYLEQHLKEAGHDVVVTREPGGTPAAEKIRDLLSDTDFGGKWTSHAELLLLFAARAEHVENVIAPALEKGQVVVCDRYVDSTRVYQGHLAQIPMEFIYDLEKRVVGDVLPHITFVLDMPVEGAMARVRERGAEDHYDQGDETFYQKLRDGFLSIAVSEKERCVLIDAHQEEKQIADIVWAQVKGHLDEHV